MGNLGGMNELPKGSNKLLSSLPFTLYSLLKPLPSPPCRGKGMLFFYPKMKGSLSHNIPVTRPKRPTKIPTFIISDCLMKPVE